ncbi:MAG: restriction endonuclease subunit S [Nitrosomonadales bacterium]|nr:restriction endonuclease subunit S [Nitrosomonadales bacterium]
MSFTPCKLKDAIELAYGKSLPARDRKDGDIPVYGSGGVGGFHNQALIEGPGIILGRKGTIGSVFYEKEDFFPIDTVYYVKTDPQNIVQRFAYYLLKNLPLKQLNTDAAVPGLNRDIAYDVKINLPDITIQNGIVKILETYDDFIENNRRRIQLLEESARLLYKEWFVQLRFPGHEHVKIINGVPEGWSLKTLTEVSAVNEQSLKKGFDGEIEYVDIASVSPNALNETTWYEFEDAPGRARRVLRHKDIIWSCVRPNRRSHALVWMPHDRLIASTGFTVISAKKISPCYLYQYLTTNSYVGYLTNNAGGAAYPAVTAKVFENSEVLVPTENLQIEYENFAESIYQEMQLLSEQNKKLAQARDILLPRLMNGALTV